MPKNKQQSILASIPDQETLRRFVQLLNTVDYWSASLLDGKKKIGGDYRSVQKELRRLVRAWFDSGPNVSKLLDANPMLAKAAQGFRLIVVPTEGRTTRLAYQTPLEYSGDVKPGEVALGQFLPFLLNPYNERLAGPCRRCGNYFVQGTKRKKNVYCSGKCGHCFTSLLANKERRNREHQKQLRRAERWIAKWQTVKTRVPWKEWVSNQALIKKHWLTRAVRGGELVEPFKQT